MREIPERLCVCSTFDVHKLETVGCRLQSNGNCSMMSSVHNTYTIHACDGQTPHDSIYSTMLHMDHTVKMYCFLMYEHWAIDEWCISYTNAQHLYYRVLIRHNKHTQMACDEVLSKYTVHMIHSTQACSIRSWLSNQ